MENDSIFLAQTLMVLFACIVHDVLAHTEVFMGVSLDIALIDLL